MASPKYPARRLPSGLPLILAGAAFVMTAWLAWERLLPAPAHVPAEPRQITPRGALADFEQASIAIFEQNARSVVHITSPEVSVPSRRGWQVLDAGTGTGFIWDARGYVVTNYHVVRNRAQVVIRMRNLRTYVGEIVDSDPAQDIAVVRMIEPPDDLRPVEIGTATDLRVGQAVFAIGNPFGLDHTLTTGVVSALNRDIESVARTTIRDVIQVDAAINPGNSGGPLLDSAGRLIGMNTAIYSPSGVNAGIGFAVPVDTINDVVPTLISGDVSTVPTADRPVLGVQLEVTSASGRLRPEIAHVYPATGAEDAGLKARRIDRRRGVYLAGDIVIAIDGQAVSRTSEVQAQLATKRVGESVLITVLRGLPYTSERHEIEVKLALSADDLQRQSEDRGRRR